MALSPFAHCRCAGSARSPSRRHSEQESYSGSFADSFCTRARLSHHLPSPQWWRRVSLTAKSYSEEFTQDPKDKDMRTSWRMPAVPQQAERRSELYTPTTRSLAG